MSISNLILSIDAKEGVARVNIVKRKVEKVEKILSELKDLGVDFELILTEEKRKEFEDIVFSLVKISPQND